MKIDNDIKLVIEEADDFPSLPVLTMEVLKMAMDPDVSLKNIANLIANDASLVTRILKIVNSAYYGYTKQITNINHAVTILGIRSIRNITLMLSFIDLFPQTQSQYYTGLFQRSLCAGLAADLIAEVADIKPRADVFLAGLLQNIGMFVFMRYLFNKYVNVIKEAEDRGIELTTVEDVMFGINNIEAGTIVAERWKLPDSIITAIKYQDSIEEAYKEKLNNDVLNIIKAAHLGRLSADIYYGCNKAHKIARFKIEMLSMFDCGNEVSEDILSSLPHLIEDVGLNLNIEIESSPNYEQILKDANFELGGSVYKYGRTYRELKLFAGKIEDKDKEIARLMEELDKSNQVVQVLVNKYELK